MSITQSAEQLLIVVTCCQVSFLQWCRGVSVQLQHVTGKCAIAGTSFLIEDVACPVDKLADMTMDLVNMFEKYGYKDASCFGHALEGNLHLVFSQVRLGDSWRGHPLVTCLRQCCLVSWSKRCADAVVKLGTALLLQGFRTPEEVERFGAMMDEMCYIVATKHSGSLKV